MRIPNQWNGDQICRSGRKAWENACKILEWLVQLLVLLEWTFPSLIPPVATALVHRTILLIWLKEKLPVKRVTQFTSARLPGADEQKLTASAS